MKKKLEIITYIALTCAAFVATYVLLDSSLAKHAASTADPTALLSRPLPLSGPNWSGRRNTIVIAMTTTCHFCHDSLPFYKNLATLEQRGVGHFQLVVISPEPEATTSKYLLDNGLRVNDVISATLASVDVSGTPTIFVADASSIVRKVYVGQLTASSQQELIAYVTQAS